MSLVDVILIRRSVRSYQKRKVPDEVLNKILEAGSQAPSASNEIKERFSHGRWNTFIKDTAFTIVGYGCVGDSYGQKWSTIDTTIALENMVIAAWE